MSYRYISQLSHVEIFTSKPDESVHFFKDVLGLQESHRDGQSVWLRAWGDHFHHSLKITEGHGPGLGHAAWRVDGPDDLDLAAKALAEVGVQGSWSDGDVGHGRSFEIDMPGGHRFELVWEMERYVAPPEQKSVYPDRPQKQVTVGAPVRRIDHCTIQSNELRAAKAALVSALRFRHMDTIVLPPGVKADGDEAFVSLTSGAHNHDLAILSELPGYDGPGGRMHHFSYFYDTREELLRALDILAEHGFRLEDGPNKHGIGELFFAYVIEPGGNRVELQTGGVWNYVADWEPVRWRIEEGAGMAWEEAAPPKFEDLNQAPDGGASDKNKELVNRG